MMPEPEAMTYEQFKEALQQTGKLLEELLKGLQQLSAPSNKPRPEPQSHKDLDNEEKAWQRQETEKKLDKVSQNLHQLRNKAPQFREHSKNDPALRTQMNESLNKQNQLIKAMNPAFQGLTLDQMSRSEDLGGNVTEAYLNSTSNNLETVRALNEPEGTLTSTINAQQKQSDKPRAFDPRATPKPKPPGSVDG